MKVIEQALLEKVIIERSRTSHKGDYGRLLLLGGTYPYVVPSSWLLWQLLKVVQDW